MTKPIVSKKWAFETGSLLSPFSRRCNPISQRDRLIAPLHAVSYIGSKNLHAGFQHLISFLARGANQLWPRNGLLKPFSTLLTRSFLFEANLVNGCLTSNLFVQSGGRASYESLTSLVNFLVLTGVRAVDCARRHCCLLHRVGSFHPVLLEGHIEAGCQFDGGKAGLRFQQIG